MSGALSSGIPKIALITGGARRIGRSIALALGRAGYSVAIHARAADREADEAAHLLRQSGIRACGLDGDLAVIETAQDLITRAAAELGALTLLVNNAAVFEDDGIGTLSLPRWDEHFAVNLRAPIFLAEAFAKQAPPHSDACIVNITDQRAFKLTPRQFSYTLTKVALDAATTMLAQALAPRVRVNAVAPGPTLPSPRQDENTFRQQASLLPLERGPSPDDIAAAVVYLASASSVTGVTLPVDGGQHIAWQTPDARLVE